MSYNNNIVYCVWNEHIDWKKNSAWKFGKMHVPNHSILACRNIEFALAMQQLLFFSLNLTQMISWKCWPGGPWKNSIAVELLENMSWSHMRLYSRSQRPLAKWRLYFRPHSECQCGSRQPSNMLLEPISNSISTSRSHMHAICLFYILPNPHDFSCWIPRF